jgi:hypothetical protein
MRASAVAVIAFLPLFACQSNKRSEEPSPRVEEQSRAVEVSVSGAEATKTGESTITLNYPESEDINDRVPDWVINPAMGGVTGSVGVASKNDLGTQEQLDDARLNGRLELVSMLESRVQRVGRTETEQDIRAEGGSSNNRSRKTGLEIDRNILDSVLAGSRQRALWFDDKTGEVYVWMVLDGGVLKSTTHSVEKEVSVFIASAVIANEYKPSRAKPLPPTVIVQMPSEPAPAPAPEQPKGPTEKLEGQLKPIETIPIKPGGETKKD